MRLLTMKSQYHDKRSNNYDGLITLYTYRIGFGCVEYGKQRNTHTNTNLHKNAKTFK